MAPNRTLKRTASQADLPMLSTSTLLHKRRRGRARRIQPPVDELSLFGWVMQKVDGGKEVATYHWRLFREKLLAWSTGELLPVSAPVQRVPLPVAPTPPPPPQPPSPEPRLVTPPLSPAVHPTSSNSSESEQFVLSPQSIVPSTSEPPEPPKRLPFHIDDEAKQSDVLQRPPLEQVAHSPWAAPQTPLKSTLGRQTSPRSGGVQKAGQRAVVQKGYKKRPHIYEKQHQAAVRERMRRDMWMNARRTDGYKADYRTWTEKEDYAQLIKDTLAKSAPAAHISVHSPAIHRPFSASLTSSYDSTKMRRVLQTAHEVLSSPRPPVPPDFYAEKKRADQLRKEAELAVGHTIPDALPREAEAEVARLLAKSGPIAKCGKESVSSEDLGRLKPLAWLNDELINMYGAMIQQRCDATLKAAGGTPGKGGKSLGKGKGRALDVYMFSSFFYSKLTGQGYEDARLGRWTKKVDVFKKDVILIPVNQANIHWTAGCINFRKKRIEFYDSMAGKGHDFFQVMREWLDKEHLDKKTKPFDFTGWEDWSSKDTPRQENGCDCGVFTCTFLEYLSRDAEFDFTQKNMPFLRKRMIWEIGRAQLGER